MSTGFTEDEAIAWPSYVDFLSTFAFVLILFVGYMAFVISNGMRDALFLSAIETVGEVIPADVQVDYENRQVVINLNQMIQFGSNCPRANCKCPEGKACVQHEFSPEQQQWLLRLGSDIARQFPDASRIILQGQADKNSTSDLYGNFDLANQRAMLVYRLFDSQNAGLEEFREKLQIANVGDKLAPHGGDDANARTVAIIVDYSGT